MELGEMIREKRRMLGMTQEELAGLAGVGPRFLSEVERGKETAEVGKLLHLLARLGLDAWIVPRGEAPGADDAERDPPGRVGPANA
jgi:HTH-type transcriptional regulator / antitoxin HipB